ncbi:hypothetical protein [Desulfosporosinus sp. OT]|uniref:hypothetical protein n=1 Tax=Desulfosporosinus sp. OT TaxID=913865 RepID=UPI0002239EE0|nr:hypothetical protein [Desulfosporosinus sp. OT]EGW37264.1 hypothetical protein DOT_4906 [Desulfosporosinus sp. OT]
MNEYIFRRELDLLTDFPEMIVQLKQDRQFSKLELEKKIELYDQCYTLVKQFFLTEYNSDEGKFDIKKAATEDMLDSARQEWKKALIREGYYDG